MDSFRHSLESGAHKTPPSAFEAAVLQLICRSFGRVRMRRRFRFAFFAVMGSADFVILAFLFLRLFWVPLDLGYFDL